jgi:hypothetical protein
MLSVSHFTELNPSADSTSATISDVLSSIPSLLHRQLPASVIGSEIEAADFP